MNSIEFGKYAVVTLMKHKAIAKSMKSGSGVQVSANGLTLTIELSNMERCGNIGSSVSHSTFFNNVAFHVTTTNKKYVELSINPERMKEFLGMKRKTKRDI